MSHSLQPHGLQHAKPPCPSLSLEVCPSSCLLHLWCYPVISFSNVLFSFCPQSFPAPGTFPMSWLFASDDQNTGASASVLPASIQGWFPLRLMGLSSLPKGLLGVFYSTTVWRHQFFGLQGQIYNINITNIQHPMWRQSAAISHFLVFWLPALPDAYLWTACHLEEWCASDQLFGRVMHMLIKTVKQTNKQKNTLLCSKIKGKCLLTSSSCKIFIS